MAIVLQRYAIFHSKEQDKNTNADVELLCLTPLQGSGAENCAYDSCPGNFHDSTQQESPTSFT